MDAIQSVAVFPAERKPALSEAESDLARRPAALPSATIASEVQHRPRCQQIKGMQGKIASNSKQNDRSAQRSYPDRPQERLRQSSPANFEKGRRSQAVCQKWQQNHSQRIHSPRGAQVSMKQLMDRAQRSAPRTIPSRQIAHRTGRKYA